MKKLALPALLLLFAATPVRAGDIRIGDPWVRATMPGQSVAGAYMEIQSAGNARLVRAASPRAARVELHEMRLDGQVMRMRPVAAVELRAGEKTVLKPGGLHLMLFGLAQPIQPGERVPLALTVEHDGKLETIEVIAAARVAGASPHRH